MEELRNLDEGDFAFVNDRDNDRGGPFEGGGYPNRATFFDASRKVYRNSIES